MRRLISERDILAAAKAGKTSLAVAKGTIVTPLARDTAKAHRIAIIVGEAAPQSSAKRQPLARPAGQLKSIAMGSDHGGFELKQVLMRFLQSEGYSVQDFGSYSTDAVDYPDIAHRVAQAVIDGTSSVGIMIDGAGIGSAMVANKVPGIRAACCNDLFLAVNSREHNGANMLTLGGRVIGEELAKQIVKVWLDTDFGGGRHQRRVAKIDAVDQRYRAGFPPKP